MVERIADLVVIESTKDSVLLPKLSAQLTDIQKRVANLLAKAVTKVTAFSLSKKSSKSWAFSFERGKIGIGGESNAGTRKNGSG
ncbi:hypothetical protein ACTQ34_17590, partial [Agathobaculum sp. LCP25S3_E8]|uniref:hypothetical protein n=1 Tax=Agathobaculum sp. LCP25S3_E8 TaxID=3438735 RepID=UPI003F91B427